MSLQKNIKSIWISDIHLGSSGTQLDKLIDFLKNIYCEQIFFNGDIIDKWLISNLKDLPTKYKPFTDTIGALKKKGISIQCLIGNHDTREAIQLLFGDVNIANSFAYKGLNKKTYLVWHGHQLDITSKSSFPWVSYFGTLGYEWLLKQKKKAKSSSKLGRQIKIFSKHVITFFSFYQSRLLRHLYSNHYDGVICGHSHQPIIKKIKLKEYINSGDWIDSCTFIAEDYDGNITLRQWK